MHKATDGTYHKSPDSQGGSSMNENSSVPTNDDEALLSFADILKISESVMAHQLLAYSRTDPEEGVEKTVFVYFPESVNDSPKAKARQVASQPFKSREQSSEIQKLEVEAEKVDEFGKFWCKATVHACITLRDGTFRERVGYGFGENMDEWGSAAQKAAQDAVDDAYLRCYQAFDCLV
ncbi:hypothetical protein JCM33374_g1411 [Metschnikowia sp. JCM 33374]|nr:hypothetical protein JCM33374_g1411 [Metschnikowia sp. JCM 33374]